MNNDLENVKKAEAEYSASSIQVLEGLEAVRKRPAMYIGDVGEKGLHHLVYEVVDNSIDEALAGFCTDIEVTINEDGSITVEDNGRGIPTDMHEKEGKSALEVVLTVLHAGGKFNKDSYKVSGGLHGVGVSCVNALSEQLIAEVHRNENIYRQTYSKGHPTSEMKIVGHINTTGTIITFKPDATIFNTVEYKYDILAARLRELAYLNKGIRLTLTDRRQKDDNGNFMSETFFSNEGLKEFVKYLDATRGEPLIDSIIYIDTEKDGVPVEVAMQYNNSFSENVHSYVNNINTIEGFDINTIPQEISYLSHFDANSSEEATKTFVDNYKKKFNGETPSQFAAAAYDCVYVLYDALTAAGESKVNASMSAEEFCRVLKEQFDGSFTYSGVTGSNMKWTRSTSGAGYVEKTATKFVVKEADNA